MLLRVCLDRNPPHRTRRRGLFGIHDLLAHMIVLGIIEILAQLCKLDPVRSLLRLRNLVPFLHIAEPPPAALLLANLVKRRDRLDPLRWRRLLPLCNLFPDLIEILLAPRTIGGLVERVHARTQRDAIAEQPLHLFAVLDRCVVDRWRRPDHPNIARVARRNKHMCRLALAEKLHRATRNLGQPLDPASNRHKPCSNLGANQRTHIWRRPQHAALNHLCDLVARLAQKHHRLAHPHNLLELLALKHPPACGRCTHRHHHHKLVVQHPFELNLAKILRRTKTEHRFRIVNRPRQHRVQLGKPRRIQITHRLVVALQLLLNPCQNGHRVVDELEIR
eukprot:comp18700_c0_seq1/m.33930 comp18700_c0_seq1/g.33930  ORF comp18700_c0_seq1/g.33930 comp18700_c0_seq1/m.33930 type:complete len:334 (+) comp18700_c0_seq1:204-1205(+)